MQMRPILMAFGQVMERKLRDNDHKGGWDRCEPEWLLRRLKEEVAELEEALARREWANVVLEAADIANFCMMLADVCWRRRND